MANTTATQSKGVRLLGWMFLIFLTLKLIGKIAWSWWWVTAPIWIPAGAVAAIFVGLLLFAAVAALVTD